MSPPPPPPMPAGKGGSVAPGWGGDRGMPAGQIHFKVSDEDCAYCKKPGHWKGECPLLKGKGKGKGGGKGGWSQDDGWGGYGY